MTSRAHDWFRQATRDLEHARHAFEHGTFEWAAFAAQQGSLGDATPRGEGSRDVFPYTREELERMKQEGNALVLGALREGVTLFRR